MPDDDAVIPTKLARPSVAKGAWVARGAVLVGDVRVAGGASIWYNCVLRGDLARVEVGEDANIQDGAVLHVDVGAPCILGAKVTVGHNAVVHAAVVEHGSLIGMGATILSGARIGSGSVVAAGALVPEGMEIPPGVVAAGIPARIRREATSRDRALIENTWRLYSQLAGLHGAKDRRRETR